MAVTLLRILLRTQIAGKIYGEGSFIRSVAKI